MPPNPRSSAVPPPATVPQTESPPATVLPTALSSIPSNKSPFNIIGKWDREILDHIQIEIGDPKETTSDFTRKKNPNNRYWKAYVTFKYGKHDSRIIKMLNCDVPHIKSSNYGIEYIVANLQREVGDAIVEAAMKKDIIANMHDKRAASTDDNWWLTINNINGRVGLIDQLGEFEPRDMGMIFTKTESGIRLNLDLVFCLRLTIDEKRDRTSKDVFNVVADCSRGAIMAVRQEVQAPTVEAAIPQQRATKQDIASQELIDALDQLLI
ncbi:hypothetical protein CDD81_3558 [Ophiocordyceps australis]|uniref:Uncharacterized protein n=1 Tax=Ophiocordyceps australis TaxID=1399860 RepID=A0A2C5XUU9_9HYPO|nr:hypothetical protein CDD81_3558 [Ophiocordyceps australis]